MIAATAKFKDALSYSHHTLTRVSVDGVQIPLESGTLTMSRTANVRRTASLTLRDDPLTPGLLDAITTSSTVVIEKGIEYLDRTTEFVTVGTLQVQEFTTTPVRAAMTVSCSDFGQLVDDYPLVTAWAPVSGGAAMTVVNAIKALVDEAVPGTPTWIVSGVSTTQTTVDGAVYKAGTGRWAAISELAAMIGAAVYPDADNVWHIASAIPVPSPVLDVATGIGGVLVQATTKATRRDTFNGVAIEWGTTDTEGGIVLAVDSNPASPTYWDGPWGRRPKATRKLAVATAAEALAAAQAELAGYKGAQDGIDFQSVYNPLLEPNDVITVTPEPGMQSLHILDQITLPLVGGTMTAQTRWVADA